MGGRRAIDRELDRPGEGAWPIEGRRQTRLPVADKVAGARRPRLVRSPPVLIADFQAWEALCRPGETGA